MVLQCHHHLYSYYYHYYFVITITSTIIIITTGFILNHYHLLYNGKLIGLVMVEHIRCLVCYLYSR